MNFVSLGFFCSIAMDLEKMGLRDTSSPFDWVISDFEMIIYGLQHKFANFLNYDNLFQLKNDKNVYYDNFYKTYFYHDFNKYKSLKEQYKNVQFKYSRRINRFYKTICEPTIFIRYISPKCDADGKNIEINYLEKNLSKIIALIKSFNDNNEIIFISDLQCISSKINIYKVPIDENDTVCRTPIITNKELSSRLLSLADNSKRSKNLSRYKKKQAKRRILKPFKKIKAGLFKIFLQEYVHDKVLSE